MTDLIGEPLSWDGSHRYHRGKVLTEQELGKMMKEFGRYLEVDGDDMPYRTNPDAHAANTICREDCEVYRQNIGCLLLEFANAITYLPKPELFPKPPKHTVEMEFSNILLQPLRCAWSHGSNSGGRNRCRRPMDQGFSLCSKN